MAEQSIFIDVKIDTGDVANKLKNVNASINTLKASNKELQEQIKKGNDVNGENSKALAEQTQALKLLESQQKALSGQLQTATSANRTYGDSFRELDAAARALENQYKSLTKAQRESAEGQQLKQQLIDMKAELKDADAELGNFQRNVGNYPQIMGGAVGKVDKALGSFGSSIQNLASGGTKAFKTIGTSVKTFGKTLLTTPVGWFAAAIAAIVAIVDKVVEAFKKNDAAMTSLQKLFAVFQPIINAVTTAFDMLATSIGKAAEWLANFIGGTNDAVKAQQNLVKAVDDLEEAERNYTVNSAKNNKEIAELRSKSVEKDKYSAAERRKFLEDAIALEKENLDAEKAIKAEHLRILEATAKQEKDTSDETMNAIAQARADLYNAETNYFNSTKKIKSQLVAFDKGEEAERKAANNAAAKAREERRKQEEADAKARAELLKHQNELQIEFSKQLEDALLSNMAEGAEKQRAQAQLAFDREISELNNRLDNEKDLTAEARESINQLIEQKQIELNNKMAEIDNAENERIKAEGEKRANERKAELQKDFELTEKALQAEYEAKALQQEIDNATEQERISLELERKAAEFELLKNLDDEQKSALFESEQAYQNKLLQLQAETNEASRALVEQRVADTQTIVNSMSGALDSIDKLVQATASNEKSAAIASKAIALGKIAVETGVALASGIAQSQSVPFPANIAAMATTVATVLANIASAVTTVKGAKFATGGIVGGTSYTGDKVQANVNSGEMILNRQQQTKLFDIANNGLQIQSSAIDYSRMADAMSVAVQETPAPTMVYSEFENFEGRVATFNEYTKI